MVALRRGKTMFHILCLRKQVVYETFQKDCLILGFSHSRAWDKEFSGGILFWRWFWEARVREWEEWNRVGEPLEDVLSKLPWGQWGLKSTRTSQKACRILPRVVHLICWLLSLLGWQLLLGNCACMAARLLLECWRRPWWEPSWNHSEPSRCNTGHWRIS